MAVASDSLDVRVSCTESDCYFEYAIDGRTWSATDGHFTPKAGRWVGAKIGLFARGSSFADFAFIRVTGK